MSILTNHMTEIWVSRMQLLCLRHRIIYRILPQSTKLNNENFHPLEVVSRYRDPQLQVAECHICLI